MGDDSSKGVDAEALVRMFCARMLQERRDRCGRGEQCGPVGLPPCLPPMFKSGDSAEVEALDLKSAEVEHNAADVLDLSLINI